MLPSDTSNHFNIPSMELKTDWSCLDGDSTGQQLTPIPFGTPSSIVGDSLSSAASAAYDYGANSMNERYTGEDTVHAAVHSSESATDLNDAWNMLSATIGLLDQTITTENFAVPTAEGPAVDIETASTRSSAPMQAIVIEPELKLEPVSMLECRIVMHPVTNKPVAAADNPWLIWVSKQRLERNRIRKEFPAVFTRLTNLRTNMLQMLKNFQEMCPMAPLQHLRSKITSVHQTLATELMDNVHLEQDLPRGYLAILSALRACDVTLYKGIEHPLKAIAATLNCRESGHTRRIAAVKNYPLLLNHLSSAPMTERERTLVCNLWCHPHVNFGNMDVVLTLDQLVKIVDSAFLTRYRRTISEVETNFTELKQTTDPKRKANLMKMLRRKKAFLLSENHLYGHDLSSRTMEILQAVDKPE